MISQLAPFVPHTIFKLISESDESKLKAPLYHEFSTCVLFCDVSGFTKLSEALAQKGPVGAEDLGFYLNRYMERLVRIIARCGGDVFKFAGDAILVLWPPTDTEPDEKELGLMVHRAAQCSFDIQEELQNVELGDQVSFSVKLGLGVGKVNILHVGGHFDRLEYLALGTPLLQAFASEHFARSGQIIMSKEAFEYIKPSFEAFVMSDENFVRLEKQLIKVKMKGIQASKISNYNCTTEDMEKKLRQYIPAAVLPIVTKELDNLWGTELRRMTVVFVNLGFDATELSQMADKKAQATKLHLVVRIVQYAIYLFEGSLNKTLLDDKGSTLIAVFGLPPLAHANDPTRAILAAITLDKLLQNVGLKPSIGITSGMAFCGLLGSSGTRREYSILGDVVNLSARLMQAAGTKTKHGVGILCDRATFLSSRNESRLKFEQLSSLAVKGKSEEVIVYKPAPSQSYSIPCPHNSVIGVDEFSLFSSVSNNSFSYHGNNFDAFKAPPVVTLVGRQAEQKILSKALTEIFSTSNILKSKCSKCNRPTLDINPILPQTKVHNAFVVKGEIGTGKSVLVEDSLRKLMKTYPQIIVAKASGDPYRTDGQFDLWFVIIRQLFKAYYSKNCVCDAPPSSNYPSSARENIEISDYKDKITRRRSLQGLTSNEIKRIQECGPSQPIRPTALEALRTVTKSSPRSSGDSNFSSPKRFAFASRQNANHSIGNDANAININEEKTDELFDEVVCKIFSHFIGSESVDNLHVLNNKIRTRFQKKKLRKQNEIKLANLPNSRSRTFTNVTTEDTKSSSPDVSDEESSEELLLNILPKLAPCVIVLENVHQFTAQEWSFLGKLHHKTRGNPNFCLILLSHPMENPIYHPRFSQIHPIYYAIQESIWTVKFKLQNLTKEGVGELVLSTWKQYSVGSLNPDFLGVIYEKTGGNPLFVVKLIDKLWSFGMVSTKYTNSGLQGNIGDYFAEDDDLDSIDPLLPMPFVAQRSFMSFIDRLSVYQQMTLKLASALCIGKKSYFQNSFDASALKSVHPYKLNDEFDADNDLESFIKMGLLREVNSELPSSSVTFISPNAYEPSDDIAEFFESPNLMEGKDHNVPFFKVSFNLKKGPIEILPPRDSVVWFPTNDEIEPKKYYFVYGFLRDLLYDNMLYQQRHRLHMKISEYFAIIINNTTKSILYRRHQLLASIHAKNASSQASKPGQLTPQIATSTTKKQSVSVPVNTLQRKYSVSESPFAFEVAPVIEEQVKAKRYIHGSRLTLEFERDLLLTQDDDDNDNMFGGAAPSSDSQISVSLTAAKSIQSNTTPIITSQKGEKKMSLMVKMPIPTSENKNNGTNPTELTPMGVRSLMTALKSDKTNRKSSASSVNLEEPKPLVLDDHIDTQEESSIWRWFSCCTSTTPVEKVRIPPPINFTNLEKEDASKIGNLKIDERLMQLRPVQQVSLVQSSSSSRGSIIDVGMLDENASPPFLLIKNGKRRSLFRPDDKNTAEVLAALLQQQKASRPLFLLKNHSLAKEFDKIKLLDKKPKPFRAQSLSSASHAPVVDFNPRIEESSFSKEDNNEISESKNSIDIAITKLLKLLTKYVINVTSGTQSEIKSDQTWNISRKKSMLFVLQTLALFKFNCFKEEFPPVMKFLVDYNPREWWTTFQERIIILEPGLAISSLHPVDKLLAKCFPGKEKIGVEFMMARDIIDALRLVDDPNFNIFDLEVISNNHSLPYIFFALFHKYNLFESLILNKEKLFRFICAVEAGYRSENPYHNACHAADVLQHVNFSLSLIKSDKFTAEDFFCMFVAAALHDFRHPGMTERFCVDANHEYSLLYNDIYVLESFHAAAAFQLILSPDEDLNIFSNWSISKRNQMKSQIIRLILATNLTDHFSFIKAFNINVGTNGIVTPENKQYAMQAILKCADVSNPAKSFPIYAEWVSRILEEFFNQGDIEKALGLTVSRFMDRDNPETPQCQIGFIDFIVTPSFKAISTFSESFKDICISTLERNREIWSEASAAEKLMLSLKAPSTETSDKSSISYKTRRVSNFTKFSKNPDDATSGIRSLPSTALPNRIFGEGRTPIYDYSYLNDDAHVQYATRVRSRLDPTSPTLNKIRNFSVDQSGAPLNAALAAVASTSMSRTSLLPPLSISIFDK